MAVSEHVEALVQIVFNNLENQQDWTELRTYNKPPLPRPLIIGLPPRRLYVHPDEQIEIIKAEKNRENPIPQPPELEWVIPLHLSEKWSVSRFAAIFDSIEAIPPGSDHLATSDDDHNEGQWKEWRASKRGRRILLATVQDDSTVVYYLMHDGIVKPRQN